MVILNNLKIEQNELLHFRFIQLIVNMRITYLNFEAKAIMIKFIKQDEKKWNVNKKTW